MRFPSITLDRWCCHWRGHVIFLPGRLLREPTPLQLEHEPAIFWECSWFRQVSNKDKIIITELFGPEWNFRSLHQQPSQCVQAKDMQGTQTHGMRCMNFTTWTKNKFVSKKFRRRLCHWAPRTSVSTPCPTRTKSQHAPWNPGRYAGTQWISRRLEDEATSEIIFQIFVIPVTNKYLDQLQILVQSWENTRTMVPQKGTYRYTSWVSPEANFISTISTLQYFRSFPRHILWERLKDVLAPLSLETRPCSGALGTENMVSFVIRNIGLD